jgi:hypothetical protein
VALAMGGPVPHVRAHEVRVAYVPRRHYNHRHEVVAANTLVRRGREPDLRVAYLEQAGNGRPSRRHAGDGDVLAYAGDNRVSRVESTRNIFDNLFASN